jgi:hypothetical protein
MSSLCGFTRDQKRLESDGDALRSMLALMNPSQGGPIFPHTAKPPIPVMKEAIENVLY